MKEENMVKKVLKNEITQLIMVASAIWFFVQTVIIPINSIQSQLAGIQLSITQVDSNYKDLDGRVTANANDLIRLKERLGLANQN